MTPLQGLSEEDGCRRRAGGRKGRKGGREGGREGERKGGRGEEKSVMRIGAFSPP
jgi:hypothetical protein